MSDYELRKLAKQFAALAKISAGQTRAQQAARTLIGGVSVEDSLTAAADSALRLELLGGSVDDLDATTRLVIDGALLPDVSGLDTAGSDLQQQLDEQGTYWGGASDGIEELRGGFETIDADDPGATIRDYESSEAVIDASLLADERVDEARDAVDAAAQLAADALSTADGKNSRRRGVTEPVPPESGWVQGDQWVRDEDRAGVMVPVQVLVWNGTEFVPEQIIADDILVFGEDGTVRIADGKVTAQSVASEFFYGRTFVGGRFEGGEFELDEIISRAVVYSHSCDNTTDWVGWGDIPVPVVVTSPKRSGTGALRLGRNATVTAARLSRSFTTASAGQPLEAVTVYLYSAGVDAHVSLDFYRGLPAGEVSAQAARVTILANVWTPVTVQARSYSTSYQGVVVVSDSTEPLYIDELLIARTQFADTGIRVGRNYVGGAEVVLTGKRSSATPPRSVLSGDSFVIEAAVLISGEAIVSGPLSVSGRLTTPGNVFALRSQLDAWATAIDGTYAWVTSEGRGYVRAGGVWRKLTDAARETDGRVNLPGTPQSGLTASVSNYEIRGGIVFITLAMSGSVPVGAAIDVWSGIPEFLRPPTNRMDAAFMSGGHSTVAWARSDGTIAIANQTGAARGGPQFTIKYPLE